MDKNSTIVRAFSDIHHANWVVIIPFSSSNHRNRVDFGRTCIKIAGVIEE